MIPVWSPTARADLGYVEAFIAEDNSPATAKTVERILDAVERLLDFPASGQPGKLPHTRELVVPGTPFFSPTGLKARSLKFSASYMVPEKGRRTENFVGLYATTCGIAERFGGNSPVYPPPPAVSAIPGISAREPASAIA
jgi:hypothetical protein